MAMNQVGQMNIEAGNQFQHMDNHQLEWMLKDYAREPKLKWRIKKKVKRKVREDPWVMRKSIKKNTLKPSNKQFSKIKKRDALQVKLCNQIFKLANNLER